MAADVSSERTSSSFVGALVHLSQNPRVLKKLREALDAAFPGGDADYVYPSQTNHVPYLEDVITEVLRLQPHIYDGLPRVTPKKKDCRLEIPSSPVMCWYMYPITQ
jgi:cytochrome P450